MPYFKFFFFLFLVTSSLNAVSTENYIDPNVTSGLLKLNANITKEQLLLFKEAKREFYKGTLEQVNPCGDQFVFYELIDPNTQSSSFFLGSNHNLPYELLPNWLTQFVEKEIDEVFLESEFATFCPKLFEKNSQDQFTKTVHSLLDPILRVFGFTASQITQESVFNLLMGYDALLGTDSTLSLLALRMKKPVFLLDPPMESTKNNLTFYRKSLMVQGLTHLLEMPDTFIMTHYIDIESNYLCEKSSSTQTLKTDLEEDLKGWLEDINRTEDPSFLEGLKAEAEYNLTCVETRNTQWFASLVSLAPSRKLICVGAGHLPDLFQKYKEAGFILKVHKKYPL
jgi:hypothetical protein